MEKLAYVRAFAIYEGRIFAARFISGAANMQKITITIQDDGSITVEAPGQKPYQCKSADECIDYVGDLLGVEDNDADDQGSDSGASADEPGALPGMDQDGGDAQSMWDEEAAKRPQNPNMMR